MAKRKRLKPADPAFLWTGSETDLSNVASGPDPDRERSHIPIADIAGSASAVAALEEVSDTLRAARDGGRLVLEIPLDQVRADHLVRDRHAIPKEEEKALMNSLRARGQQTPIEVTPLEDGTYGLISGWRRLHALRQLQKEGLDTNTVLAFVRHPKHARDAYLSMVEENEIRLGLSYYERARIAAKAVEEGVFDREKDALQTLFASASRAKRSKIKSFVKIVHALDGVLTFPEALSERSGLELSKAIEADGDLAGVLKKALRAKSPKDPLQELTILNNAMKQSLKRNIEPKKNQPAPSELSAGVGQGAVTLAGKFSMKTYADGSVRISGAGMTEAFRQQLIDFIEGVR